MKAIWFYLWILSIGIVLGILLEFSSPTNIYQITTITEDSTDPVHSIYLKSANSRQELNEYLERFSADEIVVDVMRLESQYNELYTIAIFKLID